MGQKKRIMFACGPYMLISQTVRKRVESLLYEHGYAGAYELTLYKIHECAKFSDSYDFLIATNLPPYGLTCPFVSAVPYLTDQGAEKTDEEILRLMAK